MPLAEEATCRTGPLTSAPSRPARRGFVVPVNGTQASPTSFYPKYPFGMAVLYAVKMADALAKIFDAFYRVDPARTRETGGTGLGLAIVKTCIESCGGAVTARNREPNGLEVIVKLHAAVNQE